MKKIKTACVDKLLALSSCFVITNCDKSAEDKKDGEKYGFNRLNAFVDISSSVQQKNIPEFADKTLKGVIDKVLPGLFYNSRISIQFRTLNPIDVIDCLKKINDSLGSDGSHEDIYSVLIYYNAYIHSFGIFGLRDEAPIDFIGNQINVLNTVCNELKNKKNLKREIIAWFKPDSNNTTIPYGDIKKFFNDICIAFLCSKDVADLTYPSEHFLSKTELDTEKAGFLICCDQIESHTSEILKKVNDDMNDWKHSDSPDENTIKYAGKTHDGTFGNVKHDDTIRKKNEILATISDSDKTCFTCKQLDNKTDLTHNNPRSINTEDHINSIVAGLNEIEAVLTCYADKKKEIDRDKEDFKDNFKKIDLDIERLLTAFIYRGIQYNQFFVQSGTLQSLFHFTTQEKPLDSLNNALQGITEYTGQILSGILQNIFAKANEIKQVTDPHQGVVSIDLTALQNQIYDFNQKILNDRILFEVAYNARRYLTDLFTGDNATFITKVPKQITDILTNHNTKNYGNFLKGVCNFLSTWDYGNKVNNEDPGDDTKWACQFKKFEFNKDNNPFIFEDGKEADGFDFAFNDVQKILYEKYADCVLPETFLECQQLFKRTRDICLTDNGGLFNNIAKLHTKDDFQDNTSLRSLDLLKICLPTKGETEKSSYNFFNRLPNTNGEYIDDAEKYVISDKKKDIIRAIDKIPGLVNQRKNDENCPKIDNAIGKLTNFILIDNPNEVIDICNDHGYKQDFTEWGKSYSLNDNVTLLRGGLGVVSDILVENNGVSGNKYTSLDDDPITLDNFDFTSPKNMVEKCNKQAFGENGEKFPALFAEENNFNVGTYTKFHENVFYIERSLYYVLCCIKTLGASIPRRFLKDSGKNQNLFDSYRNCRNLSLLIENALTNVLIACARPDESGVKVTGWQMLGWNDHCKLHTQEDTDKTHWGHYDIFIGPNGEEDYKESDNFSIQYSPFYSEIDERNAYAQTWEQSFLDYKSTVTNDILPISLEELKCGFFNYANSKTLIWNRTDFNNYIDSTYASAFYEAGKNPYSSCEDLQISLKRITPKLPINNFITIYWDYYKDHCLLFNETIAQSKYNIISFSDVLDAYYSSGFYFKGENVYLSLTHANTRKKYSFTTFGNDTGKKFETANTHNFSALLNDVKKCIDNFYTFYNDKKVFTSLQNVDFTDDNSKALLKFYLKNNLKIVESKDYNSDFLNCFIEPNPTLLNDLKKCIINVGKNEDRVKSFNNMTHRKQFYTEIYDVQNEDSDTKKKIEHYNKVFKLFNLEELQSGSVFEKNNHILDEKGQATYSYSDFDQRLKEKVEDFFVKVHEEWCKQVMTYSDAGKKLTDIFDGLGTKYDTLNTEVIDAVKTLKDKIKNIGDWFTRYNGNSLQNLQDCVDKIGKDYMTPNTALKELKDLLETITEGTANNNQINPTNVKNKLNDVDTYLNAVINNLPNADANELKSIFILKPNAGDDEIAKYKECKDKLEENKKELDKYKDWLNDYDQTVFTELKNCFDSLNVNLTTLVELNTNITNEMFPADLNVLKTLLGDDSGVGSIKNTCKDLKEELNKSPKVFFENSDTVKQSFNFNLEEFNTILQELITSEDQDIKNLENELTSFPEMGWIGMFEDQDDVKKQHNQFRANFDQKIYKRINDQIQSLQKCIGDIDNILKDHLKAELKKVQTLLGETKTTLNYLDDLTKTDNANSYMGIMKYISDNNIKFNTSIGKLLAGVDIDNNNGVLEKVVNWKRGDIDKAPFYRSLKDIQDELNGMLQTGKNLFEPNTITISPAADTDGGAGSVTYGDRVTITQSTIIDDNDLTKMAKDNLFKENVLKECLKG